MKRSIVLLAVLVVLLGMGRAGGETVVINEFMAANDNTLTDEDGEYSDWIELYNTSDFDVDLGGWFLTDRVTDLLRWQFPAVTIRSDDYLLVFASGKDRTDPLGELHTSFKLNTAGEYLGLILPDGMTVEHDFSPAYPPSDTRRSVQLRPYGGRQPAGVPDADAGRAERPGTGHARPAGHGRRRLADMGLAPQAKTVLRFGGVE